MDKWIFIVALEVLVLRSIATCPDQCQCENRESEFVHNTFGVVFNCSGAGLADTHITDNYASTILHLELPSNAIVRLDKTSFSGATLRGVQQLNLNGNKISVIEADSFSGLSQLRSLSLGGNNITTIPAGVFGTNTRLAFLDLSSNPHIQLPLDGFNISGLSWLDLSRCGLKEIPSKFFDATPNLQYLYLSHNRLTQVAPQSLRAISGSIQSLELYDNQLARLQPELLQVLPVSCKLFLYGNPFHCDCEFLKAYLVYKRRPFVTVLGCSTPEGLRRTRADELETILKCE